MKVPLSLVAVALAFVTPVSAMAQSHGGYGSQVYGGYRVNDGYGRSYGDRDHDRNYRQSWHGNGGGYDRGYGYDNRHHREERRERRHERRERDERYGGFGY